MSSLHATRIAAAITLIMLILIRESTPRELRPSDHGLEYQNLPPTGLKSPDMMSFFGATSKASSTPSTMALPKAMNSTDAPWWGSAGSKRRGSDHVRHVLLLGSLICGVTGVALLAASAFIYVMFKFKSSPSTNNSNNTNNKTLVPISY